MSENIFAAKSGLTEINSRPNVIIAYTDGMKSSADSLDVLLKKEEINTFPSEDGEERLRNACPAGDWHMMIVRDGGLSDPAFELLGRIREFSDIPILTVSDGCDEIYRTMALSKGADACMDADDFACFEFKARVVSMLRRYLSAEGTGRSRFEGASMLTNGIISLDRRRREVYMSGSLVRMTAIEFGIIEYLMENCGDVCTVDDIYRRVWNENPYSVKKTVVEHIRRIRSKIEPDPHNPSYIKVVFGIGYKMERAV